MKKAASRFAALSLVTLTLAASCDRSPTRPSAVPPRITRVDIVAPSSLAPGATTQLRLIARKSDGSGEDVTATARFHSQSSEVIALSPDGIATGLKVGETGVTGHNGTFSSTREVVVVPDGTFRVVGQVIEDGTSSLPVGGVRVEADGGAPSDSTGFDGRYRLYGVPAHARMRASKNGYITKELTLALSDHQTQNVALALAGPRIDVAGIYQLTIEASSDCRGQIPETLFARRYAAAVTQNGSAIRVVLGGANFYPSGSTPILPGRVEQGSVVLDLFWPSHCEGTEPDSTVTEIIDHTTYLEIGGGVARLSPAGSNFTGTLSGHFQILGAPQCRIDTSVQAWCRSPSHRVALTR